MHIHSLDLGPYFHLVGHSSRSLFGGSSWSWSIHVLILVFLLLLVALKLRREAFASTDPSVVVPIGMVAGQVAGQAGTVAVTGQAAGVTTSSSNSNSNSSNSNSSNNSNKSNVVLGKVLTSSGIGMVAAANDNVTPCWVTASDTGKRVAMPANFEAAPSRMSELLGTEDACIISTRTVGAGECDASAPSQLLYDDKVVDKLLKVPTTTPGTGGHELSCMVAFKPGAKDRDLQVYANNNTAYVQAPANTSNLQVDCQVSDWSSWSACSATCGPGTRTRTRKVVMPADNDGQACPPLTETEACKDKDCAINCELSEWSDWSACSKACGPGTKTRTRVIKTAAAHGGQDCSMDAMSETVPCQERPCPVPCKLTEWQDWSECSTECGPGVQTRARSIETPALNGGTECETPMAEVKECQKKPCPVECVMSEWSEWSACSKDCGPGTQVRSRRVLTPAAHGAEECPTDVQETRACEVKPCAVDCKVSPWTDWSTCSQPCGPGIQTRARSVDIDAMHGGAVCPAPMAESRPCNERPCPVDCKVSEWSAWSACSAACGGGTQTRSRTVETDTAHGGDACPELTESRVCNSNPCPVDCKVGAWSEWSACSKECGPGEQTRTRIIDTASAHGGLECPALSEKRECQNKPCPVHCTVSEWTDWSACSKTCGPGTQTRTRTVTTQPQHDGDACPALVEDQPCNVKPCAVDCKVGDWSSWSSCSKACGGGQQTRSRAVTTQEAHGGAACPALNETQSCNTQGCPVDCKVSDWAASSSCSRPCGGGTQTMTRSVTTAQANGGAACPVLTKTQDCNTHACPVDCQVSGWSGWSGCSASCGTGTQSRSRYVTRNTENGGASCPSLNEWQYCNTHACPRVDCQVSGWSGWSGCSKSCGTGTQSRSRYVTRYAENGGASCPSLSDTQYCNTQSCYQPRRETYSRSGCESDGTTLGCPFGTIVGGTILFGRWDLQGACGHHTVNQSTRQYWTSSGLPSQCMGQSSCSVGAWTQFLGDPVPGVYKQWQLDYTCQG
jgi:Spondin-like TSP1 domain/Thrombospondin type 1 domain